jgi:hypothetical protein
VSQFVPSPIRATSVSPILSVMFGWSMACSPVPDRRLARRMPPVACTARTRGFPKGRRGGLRRRLALGQPRNAMARRRGCSAGLLARSRATIQTIGRWRWFTRQTRPRSHKFGASHPRRSNPGLALEQRTGLNISQSRSRPMPSHLLVPIGDLKQWQLPFKRHRPRRRTPG